MALTKIDDRGLKTPIDLKDNEKIRFGTTDNDLELFHDGSHSVIQETGTGALKLVTNSSFQVRNADKDTGEYLINANINGSTTLYYDGVSKVHTNASGVDIGLSSNACHLMLFDGGEARFGNGQDLTISHVHAESANYITSKNNVLYICGKTGQTAIQIVPDAATDLRYSGVKKIETKAYGVNITDGEVRIGDAADGNDALIRLGATGSDADTHGVIAYDKSSNYLSLVVSGESHGGGGILIANGGNVGINEVSPSYQLDVKGDSGIYASAGSNSTAAQITLSGRNSSGSGSALSRLKSYPDGSSNQSHFAIETRNSSASMVEAMRITSDQKIGIGTTAPPDKLNVVGTLRINQSSAVDHNCNAGTMLEVRGDAIGSGVTDYDFFKGFKIALNDGSEWGGQAQFSVGRWQENGTNARSSLMISLGHGAQSSVSDADSDILLLTSDGQVRIEDGNLKIGTAGHGIDFSATSDASGMTNELLDNYEEGTWGNLNGNAVGSATISQNRYTRIGNQVTVKGYIGSMSNFTANSNFELGGLPYSVQDDSVGTCMTNEVNWSENDSSYIVSYVWNANIMRFYVSRDNGDWYAIKGSHLSGSTQLFFTLTYMTAA